MIQRLLTLQLLLAGGFGSVLLIPKDVRIEPAAISMTLPEYVGNWRGRPQEISKGEREILGPDTQFARNAYVLGTDQIFVSIVLSGPDMNTSIHRPERCLPAQGWTIAESSTVAVPEPAGLLPVTRLQNLQTGPSTDGQHAKIRNVVYYWFVGHSVVTPSHFERTWIDIRDRVLRGRNQQWAYVTVSSVITKDFKIFGRDEKQTDQMLQNFIRELLPQVQSLSSAPVK